MVDVVKTENIKSLNKPEGYTLTDSTNKMTRLYHMLRRKHDFMIMKGTFDPSVFMQDFAPFWRERFRNYELYTGENVEITKRKGRSDRADLSDINNKIHVPYFKTIVDQGVQMLNSNPVDFNYDNSKEVEDEMLEYQNKLLQGAEEFKIENINEEPIELIEFKSLMKDINFQTNLLEASTMQDATGTAFWKVIPNKKEYLTANDEGVSTFSELSIVKVEPWFAEKLANASVTIEDNWNEKGEMFFVMNVWTDDKNLKYSSSIVDGIQGSFYDLFATTTFTKAENDSEDGFNVETLENVLGVNPIIEFRANENRLSVFEMVEDIANAIDLTISDQQNEIEQFRLAYLFMHGEGMTRETAEAILQKGGIIHANTKDANAKYLVKELKVDFNKYHLDKMIRLLFSMSGTIDFGDEAFSGSGSSGEARQWQIKPLDDRTKVKELFIQESLYQFNKVVESFMNLSTTNYPEGIEAAKVVYNFKKSVPIDIVYLADAISKVKGVVSNYTLSGLLPMVDSKTREQMNVRIEQAEAMGSQVAAMKAEQNVQPLEVGGKVEQTAIDGENRKPKEAGATNVKSSSDNS